MFIENNWVKIEMDQYRLDIAENSYLYKNTEFDKETIIRDG